MDVRGEDRIAQSLVDAREAQERDAGVSGNGGSAAGEPARGDWGGDDAGRGRDGADGGDLLPNNCEVRPLGHRKGTYWFADPKGQIREYRRLGEAEQVSLFLGRTKWLVENFSERKGNKGWNVTEASAALIAAAVDAGWYDPDAVRGPGVWWEGDAWDGTEPGRFVIHHGDEVQRGRWFQDSGEWILQLSRPQRAGCRIGAYVYPGDKVEARPAEAPATEEEVAEYEAFLATWNYAMGEFGARLILGAQALSYIPGLLQRRPIVFVQAQSRAGKSALLKTTALVNGRAWQFEDASAPGLRDLVEGTRCSRLVIVNEFEATAENDRADGVIRFLRYNYTEGEGRSVVFGRESAPTHLFTILGGIVPPPVREQDANRRVVVRLLPLEVSEEDKLDFADRQRQAAAIGSKLYRRVLWNFGRWRETWRAYAKGMLKAGFDVRDVDTWATSMAGWDIARFDEFDPARVDEWLKVVKPEAMDKPLSIPEAALVHLLTFRIDEWAGGGKRTIGEHLADGLAAPAGSYRRNEALKSAKRFGVTLTTLGGKWTENGADGKVIVGGTDYIAVSKAHGGLESIYRGTDFGGGAWATALKELDGAMDSPIPIRLGDGSVKLGKDGEGSRSRAFVLVPASFLSAPTVAEATGGKFGDLGDDE